MKLVYVEHTDILDLQEEWNPADEVEAKALYGSDVMTVLRTSLLWPCHCFIIEHEGLCMAAIVIHSDSNSMTYFTTNRKRPVRKYMKFLRNKINAYVSLFGSITTEV